MAYSATVTWDMKTISGRRHLLISIVEAEAAAASEWSTEHTALTNPVTGPSGLGSPVPLFAVGTITHYQATKVSGTATTIQPRLGKATGWANSTQDEVARQSAAAAHVNDATSTRYTVKPGQKPALYGKSTVDAAADNVVHTTIVIVEGHLP